MDMGVIGYCPDRGLNVFFLCSFLALVFRDRRFFVVGTNKKPRLVRGEGDKDSDCKQY